MVGRRRAQERRRAVRGGRGAAGLARALGTVKTSLGRYKLTSGIESLTLSAEDAALCASAPLGLFTPNGAMLAAEDAEGLFVFPDPQAFPMDPGDPAGVLLTALTFGQPAPARQLDIDATLNPGAPGITLPASVVTDAAGKATVDVQASDPGTPRGPIDGQVFGFSGDWSTRDVILDAQSAVAVRVFSGSTAPGGAEMGRHPAALHPVQHDVPVDGGHHRPELSRHRHRQ